MHAANWLLLFRFSEHKNRIENLIRLYESHPDSKLAGRKETESTDILRAAVVLLHATFEDMCRTVERHMTPYASKEAVNAIPLKGHGDRGQPSRFLLGELLVFKGKSVDDVIKESQQEYLLRTSYNSPKDLFLMLSRYGLNKKHFVAYAPELSSLNKRRHQIVHQADWNDKKGKGQHRFTSIGKTKVKRWLKCIEGIYDAFQVATKERTK
ncbi:MAG: hypothetical protein RIQ71_866 [Verrucomicrobiota bacterium]|jgi:hypothetical protein